MFWKARQWLYVSRDKNSSSHGKTGSSVSQNDFATVPFLTKTVLSLQLAQTSSRWSRGPTCDTFSQFTFCSIVVGSLELFLSMCGSRKSLKVCHSKKICPPQSPRTRHRKGPADQRRLGTSRTERALQAHQIETERIPSPVGARRNAVSYAGRFSSFHLLTGRKASSLSDNGKAKTFRPTRRLLFSLLSELLPFRCRLQACFCLVTWRAGGWLKF